MEKKGIVREAKDEVIRIEILGEETLDCSQCKLSNVCKVDKDGRFIEIVSKSNFQIGDNVKIEIGEGRTIWFSFLLFIAPLIFIISTFLLMGKLGLEEWAALLIAIGVGVVVIAIVLMYEKRVLSKAKICRLDKDG